MDNYCFKSSWEERWCFILLPHCIFLPENISRTFLLKIPDWASLSFSSRQNFGPEITYCFFVTISFASVSVSKQQSNDSLLASLSTLLELLKYLLKYENFEQPLVCLQASWHCCGVPILTHSWFLLKLKTWFSRKHVSKEIK